MPEESRQAVIAAFFGNVALAVLKAAAAAITGSAAMLAETLHSIADTGNQALLFLGMRLAARPPDATHPLGHGRDVYFWAFVVALLLFSVGGGFAIWEAVQTFLHPEPHESYAWAYGVLAGAFVFEGGSLLVGARVFRARKGGRRLAEYVRDVRDPTVLIVVLEDSAALISIVVAAVGLALAQRTGNPRWDGIASGIIGVILIGIAVFLAFDNYSLLLGETASAETTARIRDVVGRESAALGLVDLRTLHIGPESLFIALRVRFRPELRTRDLEAAVGRLKTGISDALDGVTRPHLIVVEPASASDGGRLAAASH